MENPINPLTTQEREDIEASSPASESDESPITVSDAHTAMEYYYFADFPEAFYELPSESLAHLHSVKVQGKPLKTIRKFPKKKLIEALKKAVCKLPLFGPRAHTLYQRQSEGITNDIHELCNPDSERLSRAKQANSKRRKTRVLGHTRLQEIWADMEKTILPSWCTP